MSEEKKVLTPEEIAEKFPEIRMHDSDYLIQLIREYGEQQYTLGSHALFKEIAAKEGLECHGYIAGKGVYDEIADKKDCPSCKARVKNYFHTCQHCNYYFGS